MEEIQDSKFKIQNQRLVGTEEAARVSIEEEWRTPRDQCEKEGISRPTFFRKLKDGAYEKKYILSSKGGGKNGQQLLVRPKKNESPVYINDMPNICENISQGDDDHKSRYRINPGEPGCSVITPINNKEIQDSIFNIQDSCVPGAGDIPALPLEPEAPRTIVNVSPTNKIPLIQTGQHKGQGMRRRDYPCDSLL